MERLYLFDCPKANTFKIGVSSDVRRRLAEVQAQGYEVSAITSFFSESQDKKFILEVERILKFLLREHSIGNTASKESGFTEWYAATDTINVQVIAGMLNIFFGSRLGINVDLSKLELQGPPVEFIEVSEHMSSLVSDKNKARARYVESLLDTFEALPRYLMQFLSVSDRSTALYYTECREDKHVWYRLQNLSTKIDAIMGYVLADCLTSVVELLRSFSVHQDFTDYYRFSMSADNDKNITAFDLSIDFTILSSALKEIVNKLGDRSRAYTSLSDLGLLLALVCRDTEPTEGTVFVGVGAACKTPK